MHEKTEALSKNFSDISTTMIDIQDVDTVEIFIDHAGKLWINVDGRCRLRIGKIKKEFVIDDPVRGRVLFEDV